MNKQTNEQINEIKPQEKRLGEKRTDKRHESFGRCRVDGVCN